VTTLFSIGGTLLFAALAIVVAIGAWQRTRRVPCTACGLSIARHLEACPFGQAAQPPPSSG
jgi:hypothetical protein